MSNSAQDPNAVTTMSTDSQMETPEKADKGKGKAFDADPMDEDDEDEDSQEEAEDVEPEEPDEDNMEEIDTGNIVSRRTRGKNIDYAEAAKNLEEDDDDDEDDEDFQDDDAMED